MGERLHLHFDRVHRLTHIHPRYATDGARREVDDTGLETGAAGGFSHFQGCGERNGEIFASRFSRFYKSQHTRCFDGGFTDDLIHDIPEQPQLECLYYSNDITSTQIGPTGRLMVVLLAAMILLSVEFDLRAARMIR